MTPARSALGPQQEPRKPIHRATTPAVVGSSAAATAGVVNRVVASVVVTVLRWFLTLSLLPLGQSIHSLFHTFTISHVSWHLVTLVARTAFAFCAETVTVSLLRLYY